MLPFFLNTDSIQIQHKFNKFNEIWPKLVNFHQNYQHKLNTIKYKFKHKSTSDMNNKEYLSK